MAQAESGAARISAAAIAAFIKDAMGVVGRGVSPTQPSHARDGDYVPLSSDSSPTRPPLAAIENEEDPHAR